MPDITKRVAEMKGNDWSQVESSVSSLSLWYTQLPKSCTAELLSLLEMHMTTLTADLKDWPYGLT